MRMILRSHQLNFSLKSCLSWCVFIVFLFIKNYGQAQAVSVSPSRLFFTGNTGQEISQQITITNTGNASATFSASVMDWDRDSIGEKRYYAAGTQKLSNARWVEVLPNVIEIAPGAKKQVNVLLHVPAGEANTGVKNSMLFLTQINEQKPSQALNNNANIGVIVKLEFGIHVYYTPTGITHKELDFLAVENKGLVTVYNDKAQRIAVKIKSLSNVITDGFLNFELTNKTTGEELKPATRSISMLPGDEQIVYLDLPDSLTGSYLLVALLDGGPETTLKIAKKEINFTN